jgi:hypothetical protein
VLAKQPSALIEELSGMYHSFGIAALTSANKFKRCECSVNLEFKLLCYAIQKLIKEWAMFQPYVDL